MATKATIHQYRADGKLGVEFDSPLTLARFLAFIRGAGNPSARHFIPVLENDGVIPQDDDDFKVLLKRMGIMAPDIPNTLRAHFLVDFLRATKEAKMADQLNDWWEGLASDQRSDFLEYLRKVIKLKSFSGKKAAKKKRLISEVIIPTLDAGGYMPQSHEFISLLRNDWKMDPISLFTYIKDLFKHMTEALSTTEASKLVHKSTRTLQRWAKEGKVPADQNQWGYYKLTRQVLIDHMT